MSRTTPEWIGATDDTPIPNRVRLRVLEKYDSKCHLSGIAIGAGTKWDMDHVLALCNGGENREDNLAPVIRDKHREKTADDVALKAKIDRLRKTHLGLSVKKRGGFQTRLKKKMNGEVVRRE